ncbi:hypothetical protein HK101_007730 [Irineochytrium annulatum]|nr:hypothetical protein HK101_007730 [Irineochytrium annulatum]
MAMSIALIQPAVQAAEAVKPTASVSEAIASKATQTLQQLGYIDENEAAPAIYALKQGGFIQGKAKGYAPDAPLTRAQMASLFTRAFELKDNGIQVVYSDADQIPAVHADDAARVKQHFIIEGSAFNAKQSVTHGEFADALYLALGLDVKSDGLTPLEDFFKQPAQAGFQMSPDGKHLAYLEPWNNRMNIVVTANGQDKPARITSETERNIAGFAWATNEKLLYVQDKAGDENYHIYVTDIDGKNSKDLTPYPNTRAILVDPLENIPDEILVGMNKRDPRIFDVYRINIKTGEAVLAAENPGNITGWLTDHEGKIRVAVSSDGNVSSLLYRESEDKEFEPLLTTKLGETFAPVMFTYDNKNIYAISNLERDKTAIVEYSPSSKKVTKTIYENKDVDVSNFVPSKEKGTILAAVYETDKVNYEFFDQEFKTLMQDIKAKVPGKEVSIGSISKLDKLADAAPWIDESQMADMKPITYKSRAETSNLPLVVVPHGGPWARDSWGFNPETQFLASRGYAVLQVNFRGSTGYGKEFLDAGNKEWGKAMQNDLTDGVNWLVEEGTVDPKRVAIYGGSYGGYAALAGLAFTPDVYAAGISYVGPSNIFTLLDSLPPYWESERSMFYERVGDPVKDKELLTAISPLFHIDQMKAPLFVVQGANDPRVKQAESDQIVEALRKRGVDVPYMLKTNEGHGFANVENQLDLYRAIEKFLNRKLSDRYGRKKLFLIEVALFGIGSLLVALSTSFTFFLIARVIQALGGGGIFIIASSYVLSKFPAERQGTALGLLGGMNGVAAILGPNIGAFILDITGNWHWLFLINVPIAILLFIAGIRFIHEEQELNRAAVDWSGIAVLTLGVLSLMYSFSNLDGVNMIQSLGSPMFFGFFLAGVIILVLFYFMEKRLEGSEREPVVSTQLLGIASFRWTLLIAFFSGAILASVIFIPGFVEQYLGVSNTASGYWFTPLALASGIGAGGGGYLVDRKGPIWTLSVAGLLSAIGFLLFPLWVEHIWQFVIASTLVGIGFGMMLGAPVNVLVTEQAGENNKGIAKISYPALMYRKKATIRLIQQYTKTRGRSDTVIYAVVRPKESRVLLVSIPRDTYVQIVGRDANKDGVDDYDKLAHAYAFGGENMSINTVEKFLDADVGYYATINFDGIKKVVDALGGVKLPIDEDIVNKNPDHVQFTIEGGKPIYDGQEALYYVRYREDSDFNRTKRQQIFLNAMANEMLNLNQIAKIPELIQIMGDSFQTDMRASFIIDLAKQVLTQEKPQISSFTILDIKPVSIDANMEDLINLAKVQNFVPVVDDMDRFIGIVRRSQIIEYCEGIVAKESIKAK